jgi:hypothetical protein
MRKVSSGAAYLGRSVSTEAKKSVDEKKSKGLTIADLAPIVEKLEEKVSHDHIKTTSEMDSLMSEIQLLETTFKDNMASLQSLVTSLNKNLKVRINELSLNDQKTSTSDGHDPDELVPNDAAVAVERAPVRYMQREKRGNNIRRSESCGERVRLTRDDSIHKDANDENNTAHSSVDPIAVWLQEFGRRRHLQGDEFSQSVSLDALRRAVMDSISLEASVFDSKVAKSVDSRVSKGRRATAIASVVADPNERLCRAELAVLEVQSVFSRMNLATSYFSNKVCPRYEPFDSTLASLLATARLDNVAGMDTNPDEILLQESSMASEDLVS